MGRLVFLFIAVPVIELTLLVEIGQRIGSLSTIGLITGTGIVGAALARQQGISTLNRLRKNLIEGRVPAEPLVDGVMIFSAAVVLITPGVLTDVVGFLLLVPACRRLLKVYLKRKFSRTLQKRSAGVTMGFDGPGHTSHQRPMKNVTSRQSTNSDR